MGNVHELKKSGAPAPVKIESKMSCANCGHNNWESVDMFRMKPSGMAVCNTCGFISYPAKWQTPEEIKAHYRTDYRNPPSSANLFAAERKNHFHHKFLHPLFEEWREKGKTKPRILEIGAAYGATLNWIRTLFPEAELYGTELTTSFRRNAFHEFGIVLTEDIDESKEYDLIISYKVLEHQLEPDKELVRYAGLLSDDGHLYISVPTWFNALYNFGMSGFDLEYYFDPNHINVWTIAMFENIAMRAGFEIERGDQVIYASTYLMKPAPETRPPVEKIIHEPAKIKEALQKIQAAYLMYQDNNFKDAIHVWPNYPQAHISYAEMNRKLMTEKGWEYFEENFVLRARHDCPMSAEVVVMATDFAMRAGRWQDAIAYAEEALAMKPENPVSLNQLANIMREMAVHAKTSKERDHYFLQAREVARHLRVVSMQHFKEATDMVYFYNSKLPMPSEVKTKSERPVTSGIAAPSNPSLQEANP